MQLYQATLFQEVNVQTDATTRTFKHSFGMPILIHKLLHLI